MKPEQQRIAIAEACGWKLEGIWWTHISIPNKTIEVCPDYLHDLNAMHEAERVLDGSDWSKYTIELRRIIVRECNRAECYHPNYDGVSDFWFYHATAAQRAEAFLRTIGKWEDGK